MDYSQRDSEEAQTLCPKKVNECSATNGCLRAVPAALCLTCMGQESSTRQRVLQDLLHPLYPMLQLWPLIGLNGIDGEDQETPEHVLGPEGFVSDRT